jgi:NADH:ubiquinone oxidoreductase subunit 6 (subunit J)
MLIFIGGIGALLLLSGINNPTFGNLQRPAIDFTTIGKQMVTYYAPALIVLALALAGSVIGALALARREDMEQQNERTY